MLLCRSQAEADAVLVETDRWVTAPGRRFHPEKTRSVDVGEPGGFDVLGSHVEGGYRWPRQPSEKKLRAAVRARTPRNSGESLASIIGRVNQVLRGWYAYVRFSHDTTLGPRDGGVRRRLRRI